ncbi:VOC family protein [Polymorphobacter sp.]|uniref:VOC family protein n=1 Tax=Polymorphobacter sp. TaxID=1909290 RepID=UPI003F6F02B9
MSGERNHSSVAPLAHGGLYEVWIGVRDLEAATAYWQAFGYAVEAEAALPAALAGSLYGHAASGRSRRLRGSADHGLVRLIAWDAFANEGLGQSGLNAAGTRWVGHFARSLLTVANHAAAARALDDRIQLGDIHFIDMGRAYAHLFGGRTPEPFCDPLIALREFQLFAPETRQVFLERFGYDSPLLGTFADDSLLKTTQIVQGCMVVQSDDPAIFDFYEQVLGLWKSLELTIPYEQAQASRAIFALTPGEAHYNVDLDEPRSKPGLAERRSGRLKCFRFGTAHQMPTVHHLASPGALGLSNYSWRVTDIDAAHARASAAGATALTAIDTDEFGARAFSCRAPDGYFTTFIAA